MIFPDSSTAEINSEDLKKLSDEELRYAVNEIYARHGYIFKDDQLRTYYEQYDWYKETVKPEDFSDSVFNEVEKRNIQPFSGNVMQEITKGSRMNIRDNMTGK